MSEKTFNLTVPSGKVYQVRALPKHFFLFFGELSQALTEKALECVKDGDQEAFEREIESNLTPEQIQKSLIFVREAVKAMCVNPRISLTPQNDNEISPFEISEEDFGCLSKYAISGGLSAHGLNNLSSGTDETTHD